MHKFFPFFFCFLFHGFLQAQQFEQELKEAIHGKARLDLRLDSRHSFISESGVRVLGAKIGLQFENKLSIGIGYNQMTSTLINRDISWNEIALEGQLEYRYFSPYVDYIFYQDEKWELSIPVQFGIGRSYYRNLGDLGPNRLKEKTVISYEPAITFQYRIFDFIGVGMGVGYRLMLKPNPGIEERFTSPVYLFKFKLYFQDLIDAVK